MKKFNELDVVKLIHERPDVGVPKGALGAIVYVHNDGEAFTIEFVDDNNETIDASLWVEFTPDEIELDTPIASMMPNGTA